MEQNRILLPSLSCYNPLTPNSTSEVQGTLHDTMRGKLRICNSKGEMVEITCRKFSVNLTHMLTHQAKSSHVTASHNKLFGGETGEWMLQRSLIT